MTYPPQQGPPPGQQPGQFGQGQPYQGQPYQGQPYQGQQSFGQQQYPPQQQYPGQGYPPPGPPPKKKTGLIVGISAGVVVLLALGITGFVAPGFFLGDDAGSTNATGSPADTASSFVTALTGHHQEAVSALYCADADSKSRQYGVDIVNKKFTVALDQPPTGDTAALTVDNAGKKIMFDAKLANQGGKWCVQKMTLVFARNPGANGGSPTGGKTSTAPTAGSAPAADPAQGQELAQKFVAAVNAKDQGTALGFGCQRAETMLKAGINRLGDSPAIALGSAKPGPGGSLSFTLTGTTSDGKTVGGTVQVTNSTGTYCVQNMLVLVN
ncbi:hypothetical protein SAMN05421504_102678 [Amycolatopsis xylanica]|uniref:DUF4878 domain-containing protein n=1 Tax=Amycolatopsis xylanica TaxID=589385 RepID=A0A1H2ZVA5_9PSEU|nr:hypothetical protein [Amycolatopsis xylanica]SDX21227.1 hypothetical protein SAMN05421504_102678 [Amycolatopsis xylanica]